MLICISGVDCAGKTTQIEKLANALVETRRVEVFWYRPGYSRELDSLRRLVRRASPGVLPAAGDSSEREEAFRKLWVKRLWLTLALVDMAVQYGVKVRLKSLIGTCVVCDRYLEDGLIDLSLRLPELVHTDGCVAKFLRAVCPKPDHAFLLMLSDEVQKARMEAKQEPFPDAEPVRQARRLDYEALARSGRAKVIDASRSVGEVAAEIFREMGLKRSMGC